MKAFNCILGVFSIIASFFCMMYPGKTFLGAGWILTILLCLWGACALFEVFHNRKTSGKGMTAWAVFALIGGVLSAIMSIIVMVKPGFSAIADMTFVYTMVVWLIVSGIASIVTAVKVIRPTGSKWWVFTLVWGILTVLGGLYGIVHVFVMAWTLGLLFGIQLLLYGVRLIGSVFEA